MNLLRSTTGRLLMSAGCLAASAMLSGCFQTTIGGQTLPSAHYLEDDVQYFPAGPETRLYNEIQALDRYKLERQKLQEGNE